MTFAHSGDLGDIIAALPTIRAAGGGILHLFHSPGKTREPMTQKRCDLIRPLLIQQDYIQDVVYMERCADHNLNGFRHHLKDGRTLADAHLATMGFKPIERSKQWLHVEPLEPPAPVIFARSPRYQNTQFNWQRVHQTYKDKAVFIGLQEEHQMFEKQVGAVPFLPCSDLLEVARYIAGAKLFVGNQSCPLNIAHGLKAPVVQETCIGGSDNCYYARMNTVYGRDNYIELPSVD